MQVTRHAVTLPRLSSEFDGLRVVQLSDTHCGPSFMNVAQIRRAVKLANELHPDLVLMTGDYVNRADSARRCDRVLSELHTRYGVYAALGNHDYWTDPIAVTRALRAVGIKVLINEAMPIRRGSARLWIAGLDDAMDGQPNIIATLPPVPPENRSSCWCTTDLATIIARGPVDMQLSGHVHGGQVRLPWIGAIITPFLGHRYPMGMY